MFFDDLIVKIEFIYLDSILKGLCIFALISYDSDVLQNICLYKGQRNILRNIIETILIK